MTFTSMENCGFLPSFCETGVDHCGKIPCTRTYDCLNRKDEDYNFCIQSVGNKTLESIEKIQNEYNG